MLQGKSPLDTLLNWQESDSATPVVVSHSFVHGLAYLEARRPTCRCLPNTWSINSSMPAEL